MYQENAELRLPDIEEDRMMDGENVHKAFFSGADSSCPSALAPETLAIKAKDLTYRYYEQGKRNILDHADIVIDAGKITVLMGSSGCGKSTLGLVLGGLLPENGGVLESGSIELFGCRLSELSSRERAGLLGMMFQNPDLQYCMDTLRREMIFCLENMGCDPEDMDRKIDEAAMHFHMEGLLDRKLRTLSGGEKQKGILACLYLMESRCIFLDEPFANIDPEASEEILESLENLRDQGRTIVAIDHRADLWADHADEIKVLGEGGRVLAEGINRDNIEDFRKLFQREGIFFPGEAGDACGSEDRACSIFSASEAKDIRRVCDPTLSASPAEVRDSHVLPVSFRQKALEVNIKKLYDRGEKLRKRGLLQKLSGKERGSGALPGKSSRSKPILCDIRLSFEKGSMTALLGPSGSGKTSFLLSLLGQCAYEGEILIHGRELGTIRENELYSDIGMVFQNPADQFITQKVGDEMEKSLEIWRPELSEEERSKEADRLLSDYSLERFRNYSPFMLSQGQQRRLAVLAVLAGGQSILLLDEPTYGQDSRSCRAMMEHISKKAESEGLTVIFTTHDGYMAKRWAQRRLIVRDGRISEE